MTNLTKMTGGPFDGKAVLTGAGKSQVGRRLGRTGLDLTLEAVLRAIADAGLSIDDVDGIASYPGPGVPDPGFSGATVQEVRNALGLRSRWYVSSLETAGQIGPAIEACMAVSLGLANHVVVYRSVWESTAAQQAGGGRASVLFGAVWRTVGGELAGDAHPALYARIRPDPRAPGPHRDQRPQQRRTQPGRD